MVNGKIIAKSIGVGVVAAILVAAIVWGYKMTPTSLPCVSLDYTIADREERLYLSEAELNQLLRTENLYPVGRPIDRISLHRIEKAVAHHPMVRTAECYLTPRNEVHVRLTQRIPLLRVQVATDSYFVDTDRRVMPVRAAVQDEVLLVTGNAGIQLASGALANFAIWLQDNSYWRNRIKRVHVVNPHMLVLHMSDAQIPPVVLGNLTGYNRKLTKLRTFLEDGTEETAGKAYTELDIRFHGQVIGRK
ncbi:MAG: hypothetical protein IJQ32_06385 [Paludibacteraceae bacterium]|nr:hypothetical protein [Paludibacteraceae bacterium]